MVDQLPAGRKFREIARIEPAIPEPESRFGGIADLARDHAGRSQSNPADTSGRQGLPLVIDDLDFHTRDNITDDARNASHRFRPGDRDDARLIAAIANIEIGREALLNLLAKDLGHECGTQTERLNAGKQVFAVFRGFKQFDGMGRNSRKIVDAMLGDNVDDRINVHGVKQRDASTRRHTHQGARFDGVEANVAERQKLAFRATGQFVPTGSEACVARLMGEQA